LLVVVLLRFVNVDQHLQQVSGLDGAENLRDTERI
jgi:hypothetical protein